MKAIQNEYVECSRFCTSCDARNAPLTKNEEIFSSSEKLHTHTHTHTHHCSRLKQTAKARVARENEINSKGKDPEKDEIKILAFPETVENWEEAWGNVQKYARPYQVGGVFCWEFASAEISVRSDVCMYT